MSDVEVADLLSSQKKLSKDFQKYCKGLAELNSACDLIYILMIKI